VIADDGNSARSLLAEDGNYRFTAYVYMPAGKVISGKPALLLNPTESGGLGSPVVAPFRVYLNGELVADAQTAYSGSLSDLTVADYNVTYAYQQGWNKFEILVHNTGVTGGDVSLDGTVADSGVGIYIAGNPYELARLDPNIRVQAHAEEERLVSEFALRRLVRPGDDSCWAWTDTAPQRDVLLNYDPRVSVGYSQFDGLNAFESPTLALSWYSAGSERPTSLKFRAILERDPAAVGVPRLNSYGLVINKVGG
jgi:hypothetical protein